MDNIFKSLKLTQRLFEQNKKGMISEWFFFILGGKFDSKINHQKNLYTVYDLNFFYFPFKIHFFMKFNDRYFNFFSDANNGGII